MKKYLVGDFLHSYTIEEGFSWILLDGEGEFALVTGIGYMFSSSCYTKTVCAPGRCVWEASAFIRTDKYINPEYPQPTFNISNTKNFFRKLKIIFSQLVNLILHLIIIFTSTFPNR